MTCVICLGSTNLENKANEFDGCKCTSNYFHKNCFVNYISTFKKCPTCRKPLIIGDVKVNCLALLGILLFLGIDQFELILSLLNINNFNLFTTQEVIIFIISIFCSFIYSVTDICMIIGVVTQNAILQNRVWKYKASVLNIIIVLIYSSSNLLASIIFFGGDWEYVSLGWNILIVFKSMELIISACFFVIMLCVLTCINLMQPQNTL